MVIDQSPTAMEKKSGHAGLPVEPCGFGGCQGFMPTLPEVIAAIVLALVIAGVWFALRRKRRGGRGSSGGR